MDANEAKATLKAGLEAAEGDLKRAQEEMREAEKRVKKCETEVARFKGAYRMLTGEMPPGPILSSPPEPKPAPSNDSTLNSPYERMILQEPVAQLPRPNGEKFNVYRPVCVEITAFLAGRTLGGQFFTRDIAPIISRFYTTDNKDYLREIARCYLQHFINKGLVVKSGRSKATVYSVTDKFHVTLGSAEEAKRRIEEERKMMKDLMDK